MAATIIAAVAIVVSMATFWLTKRSSDTAERRTRMPIVVLFPDDESGGWRLENIGRGAALNIVIAQGSRDAGNPISLHDKEIDEDGTAPGERWCNPIHLRPMSSGAEQVVPWRFSTTGVAISFTDALGNPYTLRSSRGGSALLERQAMPSWSEDQWRQISEIERWVRSRPPQDGMERDSMKSVPWPVPWAERG